jgi:hypothetical protein
MDDDERPLSRIPPRATRARQTWTTIPTSAPTPAPKSSAPTLSVAVGCLAAGGWSLFFVRWFALTGPFAIVVTGLGFLLVCLGLLLLGSGIAELAGRRKR